MLQSISRARLMAAALFATVSLSGMAVAEDTVMVGGAPMYPSKNIVENAVNSKDHTTLVAAVKAAGLVDTLASPGPSPSSRRSTTPSRRSLPAPWTRSSSRKARTC